MFVIPGVFALLMFVYWRLHELFEGMHWFGVNFVLGLAALGFVIDYGIGVNRPRGSALLYLLLALFGLAIVGAVIKAPESLTAQLTIFGVDIAAFFLLSEGVQTLRGLATVSAIVLAFTLALAAIGVQQGLSPSVCYTAANGPGGKDTPDGRTCASISDCLHGGKMDTDYFCEHPGVFGSHSIGGRVRFRGVIEDPNELAWAVCVGMPLAFAAFQLRRSWPRGIVLAAAVVGSTVCVIMTQSRSGQLAILAVFGVYFARRFGLRGLLLGALVGLPVLMLGGRGGEAAESSSDERLGCWAEGLAMWRANPLSGVGAGQFTEHHYLTAHNSFVLTLAEMGPLGLLLWTSAIYFAFKITIQIQRELATDKDAKAACIWATALLASLAGTAVSALFLSMAYRTLLWIMLGLVGALYSAVRKHDPTFRVRFGWKDMALVFGGDTALMTFTALYLRLKGV
jgi:hypothetical protein